MGAVHNVRVLSAADVRAVASELVALGMSVDGAAASAPQGVLRLVRADALAGSAVRILHHACTSLGATCFAKLAPAGGIPADTGDIAIAATLQQFDALLATLRGQPELETLVAELGVVLNAASVSPPDALHLRSRQLRWGERTYIMGIINTTPDSFSGDGLAVSGDALVERAVAQARQFAADGADILDVGGESTRPGAAEVSTAEELARVLPVIAALRRELDLPISVDTWKPEVAAAALDAGADLVNNVWGMRLPDGGWSPAMAALVRRRDVPIVIMHNRRARASQSRIGGHYRQVEYHDVLGDILRDLREDIEYALGHGVAARQIIVDPGIGFGKTPAQNVVVLRRLGEFRSLGFPLLLGTSRKSFIGQVLGGVPPGERLEGTAATVAVGIQAGADIVRVHDVAAMARVARMTDALVRPGAWERLTSALA